MAALLPGCVNTKFRTDAALPGFVSADEPRAAAIGREILNQGGTAGDAAAAMALAMTATLPSRVGLTGGGVCVAFDAAKKEARTIDFLPRTAGPGGAAMPALLRGIAALQATAGTMRWEQVAVPAEQVAQFSPGVSRALVQDLTDYGNRLPGDSEMRRRLMPAGGVPAIGTTLSQPELAATLSQIRRNGVPAFYTGQIGTALAQGLGIDLATLRAFQPKITGTVKVPLGIVDAHFAQLPETATGTGLAEAWKAVAELPPAERAARAARLLGAGGRGAGVPGAGLVAMDMNENSVACALTMGAPFGNGRSIPGTGLLAAQGVTTGGFGAPGLVANSIVGRSLFTGVGTATGDDGPAAGPAALLAAILPSALDERGAEAIAASIAPDQPGRSQFVACQVAQENGVKTCKTGADPRGAAMGAMIAKERPRE
ncbi:gamma-glutamyltransferase [Azospirillum thermophilum]|uniref:gamma-glutamyltransferase n=1 Tax=Azospirillum thermophilum TaxID=2202148 RepID=UPI001FED0DEA|nr:gamma-glutamyltransferase [Azospirillum thermophilum]